jgi:hypothetical protein
MRERLMEARTSTPHAAAKRPRPSRLALAFLVVGIALFWLALARAGLPEIGAQLRQVGPRVAWLLLPYAAGTAISAWPWALLLPARSRPRPLGALAGRFVASSANAILPFFGLAGEPLRLLWLEQDAKAEGVAAIVVDRALYNTSNGLLLLAGAAIALSGTPLPAALSLGAAAAALATLLVTLLVLWVAVRAGIGRRLQAVLSRMLGSEYRDGSFGRTVDATVLVMLRSGGLRLALGTLTHVLGRSVILLEVYLALGFLGIPYSMADATALAVVPIGLSLVFSSIPSQLGVQEGGQALVAAALGMSPSVGVTLVLLQRFRQLVFAALAPVWLNVARSRGIPAPAASFAAEGAEQPRRRSRAARDS